MTIFSEPQTRACNLTKDFDVATSMYRRQPGSWDNTWQNIESS